MEFFMLGVLTALLPLAILNVRKRKNSSNEVALRQTLVHSLMKYMIKAGLGGKKESQSKIHSESKLVRFVQTPDNIIYWIEDNVFYRSSIIEGYFNPQVREEVKTKDLSRKEIASLAAIMDALTNGRT
jgi:hypothetical protein